MRNLNSKVRESKLFVTQSGSDVHILYSSKVLPNGQIRLTPSGKESITEKINAQKEFTDMSYIISRLMVGDTSVLRDGAVYGDFTVAPKSLAESLQIIIDGQQKFDALPLDVKNKFDNNYMKWIMQSGSVDWFNKMGLVKPVEEKPIDKPVEPIGEIKE